MKKNVDETESKSRKLHNILVQRWVEIKNDLQTQTLAVVVASELHENDCVIFQHNFPKTAKKRARGRNLIIVQMSSPEVFLLSLSPPQAALMS